MTEAEKLQALRDALERYLEFPSNIDAAARLRVALCAYDPPKPRVPQIPAWEEFARGRIGRTAGEPVGPAQRIQLDEQLDIWIHCDQYNAIRHATSKEAE